MAELRTRASIELTSWMETQGGLRAGARALGIHHNILSRWVKGEQIPKSDGATSRDWIAERTGVDAEGWDILVQTAAPPPRQDEPKLDNVRRLPANGASKRPSVARAIGSLSEEPKAPEQPTRETPAPASLASLQERLRQIPAELAALRESLIDGEIKVPQAECLRRLLEGEAKALTGAVTSSGIASVSEVEQLEALVISCTASCEACKARVADALRELKSS
jgi:hypothetical protein